MRIKFHGARGSFPVSVTQKRVHEIARNVFEFAQKRNLKTWDQIVGALSDQKHSLHSVYGGATTCAEVFSDQGQSLFIDLGTGLTSAGMDPESSLSDPSFKQGRGRANILVTHTHWDHIIGLPTVDQLYRVGNQFNIYGVHKKLSERLGALFSEMHFPVPFSVVEKNLNFHQINLNADIKIDGFDIKHFAQSHPGGSFAYRITQDGRSLVFATDVELKKSMVVSEFGDFYRNCDVLVMDAQYSPEEAPMREGYGHSDIYLTVDFAVEQGARTLVLFHQSPSYDDSSIDVQLRRAQEHLAEKHSHSPLKIVMAIEGNTLEI